MCFKCRFKAPAIMCRHTSQYVECMDCMSSESSQVHSEVAGTKKKIVRSLKQSLEAVTELSLNYCAKKESTDHICVHIDIRYKLI